MSQSSVAVFVIAFVIAFIIIKSALFLLSFVITQLVSLWVNSATIRYNLSIGYYHF